jgi:hypothetical protein
VIEAGIRVSADPDCNEERAAAAAAGQTIVRMLAFLLEKIMMGKETSLVSYSFTISSVTHKNSLSRSKPASS